MPEPVDILPKRRVPTGPRWVLITTSELTGRKAEDMLAWFERRTNRRHVVSAIRDEQTVRITYVAEDQAQAIKRARYLFGDLAMWPNNSSMLSRFTLERLTEGPGPA